MGMVADPAYTGCDHQRIPCILALEYLFDPTVKPEIDPDIFNRTVTKCKVKFRFPFDLLDELFDLDLFHWSYSKSLWLKRLILKLLTTPVSVR